jgi:hypothetical protein
LSEFVDEPLSEDKVLDPGPFLTYAPQGKMNNPSKLS